MFHKVRIFLKILLPIILLLLLFVGIFVWRKANVRINLDNLNFFSEKPTEDFIFKKFAYISGQVNKPGVYEINEGMRVLDLINLAEGFSPEADQEFVNKNLNLAEKLNDEQKVYIPSINESSNTTKNNSEDSNSGLININQATLEELDQLPGIGKSTAEKIINARPFESIEGLKDVSGIGDAKFEDIQDLISI